MAAPATRGFLPHNIRCFRHKAGLNTFAGLPNGAGYVRRFGMTVFADKFLAETVDIIRDIDVAAVEHCASGLAEVRRRGGRLFVLGVGGSAAHASHAVNDFRKICGFEAYAPTDNVAELTARGTMTTVGTRVRPGGSGVRISRAADGLLVLSVGGGDKEPGGYRSISSAPSIWHEAGALRSGAWWDGMAATPPKWPTRA